MAVECFAECPKETKRLKNVSAASECPPGGAGDAHADQEPCCHTERVPIEGLASRVCVVLGFTTRNPGSLSKRLEGSVCNFRCHLRGFLCRFDY